MPSRSDRVVIAVDAVGIQNGGGMSVLLAFLDAALERDDLSIVLFSTPDSSRNLPFPTHPSLTVVAKPREFAHPLRRIWWYERGFRRVATAAGAAVTLSLSGAALPANGIPGVTLIQQSLPFSREALDCFGVSDRSKLRILRGYMERACRRSAAVLVQTRTMVVAVSTAFMLPQSKLVAALTLPPTLELRDKPEPSLRGMRAAPRGRRVLYVGNNSPYKNIPSLTGAITSLSDSDGSPILFLTTTPERYSGDRVVALGPLSPSALAEAYSLADVLVLPSYTETVGLPLIEAMRAGLPVCVADRPYAHEICGSAGLYMEPRNSATIAAALRRMLTDSDLRRRLIVHGKARAAELAADAGYDRMLDLLVRLGNAPVGALSEPDPYTGFGSLP